MAKKNRFSPAQSAKIILEEYIKRNKEDPEEFSKEKISKLIRDTTLIDDQKLGKSLLEL